MEINRASTKTKVRLFDIPVLMYGSECWCLQQREDYGSRNGLAQENNESKKKRHVTKWS